MRVYAGCGPRTGQVIVGDSDARGMMYAELGICPIDGWHNIDKDFLAVFDREMLDWFYSEHDKDWVIYASEDEYIADTGAA